MDAWFRTLTEQPSAADITTACAKINDETDADPITDADVKSALKKYNLAQLNRYVRDDTRPDINLLHMEFRWTDAETAELTTLVKDMPRTMTRRTRPFVERYNAARAAARVPLVTDERVSGKCSHLRELLRKARSLEPFAFPNTYSMTLDVCVFVLI
jgi:hypothetical protein